jgi:glycosyltransferase involved in cell wall biosynthesis
MITSNAGDMELLVKKYGLGYVAKKEDPSSLANAIRQFIEKPVQIYPTEREKLLNELLFENSSLILLNTI